MNKALKDRISKSPRFAIDRAYLAGIIAGKHGEPIEANPYPEPPYGRCGNTPYAHWSRGWLAGKSGRTLTKEPRQCIMPKSDGKEFLVLADIRAAVGDPGGKLMQAELVQRAKDIVHALGTAVVLAERGMMPGPKLIEEWKTILPKGETT